MGKKRIPSIEDALKTFKDVVDRASLKEYVKNKMTLLSKSPKGYSIIIVPDQSLWNVIAKDETLKPMIRELDSSKPEDLSMQYLFAYGDEIEKDSWVPIDPDILFSGKIFKINIKGFEYEVPINRDLLPLKLRKAEYNNIYYKVLTGSNNILLVKKRFETKDVEDSSFTMMRVFKIL